MGDLQRQIGERAQAAAEPTLLDLVRRYGEELGAEGRGDLNAGRAADILFARIAALVPTLPVQARDIDGDPWFIHGCGIVLSAGMNLHEQVCRHSGPWRPLYVASDAAPCPTCSGPIRETSGMVCQTCGTDYAPDGDREPEECGALFDDPLGRPQPPCRKAKGHEHGPDTDWKRDLHSNGSLKWPVAPDGDRAPGWISPKDAETLRAAVDRYGNILREVMAALGVDRAEDVLGAVAADRELITELLQQRDEAHAEIERIRGQWRNDAEIGDEYAAWADRLARAALKHADVHETEEASGSEELWGLAELIRATMPAPDGRIVLRLPEPPPGTVALIGASGRWVWSEEYKGWSTRDRGPITLSRLLHIEQPDGVTVELAPEPGPQQPRTAAEVWRALEGARKSDLRRDEYAELAEALDREVAAEAQRRYVAERGAR